jgi:hypothetical protein
VTAADVASFTATHLDVPVTWAVRKMEGTRALVVLPVTALRVVDTLDAP